MDKKTQPGVWGRKGGRGKPNGHKLCHISCYQDEQSSLSSILRHCLSTSSNKPHVWAVMPLLSWSCSQECFLQPFLWGVKVTLEPGVLKDHYTPSASASAHIPPRGFCCYPTALSPAHFRLLHHWSPGCSPHRTCAMVSQSRRDGSLGQPQKSPGTWKERSISKALQQLFPKWKGNSEARIVSVKPGDKGSSAKGVSITEHCSRESKLIQNVCIHFSGLLLTEKSWPWKKKLIHLFLTRKTQATRTQKATLTDMHLEK